MAKINYCITKVIILLIKAYRYFISPLLASSCRFHPSCSCYGIDAINSHGVCKGILLTAKRLSKCHPWHQGGYDPVPRR